MLNTVSCQSQHWKVRETHKVRANMLGVHYVCSTIVRSYLIKELRSLEKDYLSCIRQLIKRAGNIYELFVRPTLAALLSAVLNVHDPGGP